MVVYDLICEHGHSFEGWFNSELDYKNQLASHMLSCPMCESSQVKKIPSASYVVARSQTDSSSNKQPSVTEKQQAITQLANYLIKNTEDVGNRFAEEAKKIHYGEAEQRGIRGQATNEEVKELKEEGINMLALPGNIIEKNKLN